MYVEIDGAKGSVFRGEDEIYIRIGRCTPINIQHNHACGLGVYRDREARSRLVSSLGQSRSRSRSRSVSVSVCLGLGLGGLGRGLGLGRLGLGVDNFRS
jgi:hypothetical protein